jgi:hypothetical protein
MKIEINQLKNLSEIIFRKIEDLGFEEVSIDVDLYWNVSFEDAYNLSVEHPDIVVGSLIDDWEWLRKVLNKKNPATTVDLERLGSVIEVLGRQLYRLQNGIRYGDCMTIKIVDMKKLCESILTKAEKSNFKKIEIDIDHYWGFNLDAAYNMAEHPKPIIKSLVNIEEKFNSILSNKHQLESVDFELVGRTMKIFGEAINRSQDKIYWLLDK